MHGSRCGEWPRGCFFDTTHNALWWNPEGDPRSALGTANALCRCGALQRDDRPPAARLRGLTVIARHWVGGAVLHNETVPAAALGISASEPSAPTSAPPPAAATAAPAVGAECSADLAPPAAALPSSAPAPPTAAALPPPRSGDQLAPLPPDQGAAEGAVLRAGEAATLQVRFTLGGAGGACSALLCRAFPAITLTLLASVTPDADGAGSLRDYVLHGSMFTLDCPEL
eukprot:TRINITY_DN42220_c0_g1_i1.p4 TRINITY_DN42220_c0_g1~~TRINITY_DN42220_c0_g1_i1.p4  ORF type:complete len:228 (+),score=57.42 TRINITY_DN42220_c0_g1_i1:645-1328(+)